MTYFDYLDGKFRSLSLELQKDWTLSKDAELKSAYQLIQVHRTLLKWFWMPIHIGRYWLIHLKVFKTPSPVVEAAMQQTNEQQAQKAEESQVLAN